MIGLITTNYVFIKNMVDLTTILPLDLPIDPRDFCESSSGTDKGEVRSSVGLYGDWQTPLLCHGEEEAVAFLRGVQFRSEKETKAKGNP